MLLEKGLGFRSGISGLERIGKEGIGRNSEKEFFCLKVNNIKIDFYIKTKDIPYDPP